MGYRRSYNGPDTPGERAIHVGAVAAFWGMGGWIVAAILAKGEDGWWVFYLGGFLMIFFLGHFYTKEAEAQNKGTYTEMAANPDLNTQDFQLHYKRLTEFGHSKYNGETEYMGPRGGIYTITASGNRNYRR